MKLSVVMPVYNEAATIEQAVRRVLESEFDKELIIVDDGSTDGTRDILRNLHDPRTKVFYHDRNQGKGASLQTGFSHISGDVVIVQDADLEYHPRDYAALIRPIADGDADVVYGSRFLGGPHRVLYFWHFVGNLLLTTVTNLLYNVNLSDMETGYKAFRREVLNRITLRARSFDFEVEFTAKAIKQKFRLYETPVSYAGRTYAEGKKIGWKDGVQALACLLKYRFVD
jgi:glycosyltransferase involved in cell wall biosynthesis